jgi:HlyD family secretion protein
MNRRRLIVLVVVVLLAVAAFATRGFGLMPGRPDTELSLYGNVDIREVDMGFRVGGRIAGIGVEEGAKVTRGQLLATLDTATIDSRVAESDARVAQAQANYDKARNGARVQDVAQARARVAAAQAVYDNAQRDVARRQALVEPGAISRDLWEQTRSDRDRAAAQLAEARQGLSLLQAGTRREDVAAAAADWARRRLRGRASPPIVRTRGWSPPPPAPIVTRAREPGAIVQPGETVLTLSITGRCACGPMSPRPISAGSARA